MKWIILLAGVLNLIFAYLIISKAPRTYFKLYFSVFVFLAVAWIFSNYALINFGSSFWLRTTYALGAVVVTAALVWVIGFKDERKALTLNLLASCYGLGAFFFVLCYINNLFLTEVANEATVVKGVYGPFFPIYTLFTSAVMLLLLFKTIQYIYVFNGAKKTQAQYIFWGLLGYIAVTTFVSLILPLFGYPQLGFLDSPSSLFFIGFTTYAMTKHRLMDISVIISRAVAEVLAVILHSAIYLTLVWLYRQHVSERIDYLFIAWTILYGIVVGQTHLRLRLFFQTSADKLFLKGRYNYYQALVDVSSRVGRKLSLRDILLLLYDTFRDVMEISNPRVFLPEYFSEPEKTSNRYLIYSSETMRPDLIGQEIRLNDPLVDELISKGEPLHDIKELKAALVVPCLLESRLIATFVLGPKLSEDAYTDEDIRLLKVLANQVAVALDHTHSYERIKVDLEVAERQLERSARLASLGTLTAGVTHEIRNPLTVIHAETERLANEARDLEYLKNYRELMLKHIDRITGIVNRMLSLAKDKPKKEEEVNLPDLIESTLLFFKNNDKANFIKELGKTPPIKGDLEELQEVFVNLIQNAIEAMPGGGTITLRTFVEEHRPVVEISDTGKGIPPEIREKIFDPFYSTRHEGVGLGLSIVYRIIRAHGGDVKVTSEVGKGTTFKILF